MFFLILTNQICNYWHLFSKCRNRMILRWCRCRHRQDRWRVCLGYLWMFSFRRLLLSPGQPIHINMMCPHQTSGNHCRFLLQAWLCWSQTHRSGSYRYLRKRICRVLSWSVGRQERFSFDCETVWSEIHNVKSPQVLQKSVSLDYEDRGSHSILPDHL